MLASEAELTDNETADSDSEGVYEFTQDAHYSDQRDPQRGRARARRVSRVLAFWHVVCETFQKIVDSKYFGRGIMVAILINTLSMGIEYHEQVSAVPVAPGSGDAGSVTGPNPAAGRMVWGERHWGAVGSVPGQSRPDFSPLSLLPACRQLSPWLVRGCVSSCIPAPPGMLSTVPRPPSCGQHHALLVSAARGPRRGSSRLPLCLC